MCSCDYCGESVVGEAVVMFGGSPLHVDCHLQLNEEREALEPHNDVDEYENEYIDYVLSRLAAFEAVDKNRG
mgnify:CR=1 FL=1